MKGGGKGQNKEGMESARRVFFLLFWFYFVLCFLLFTCVFAYHRWGLPRKRVGTEGGILAQALNIPKKVYLFTLQLPRRGSESIGKDRTKLAPEQR